MKEYALLKDLFSKDGIARRIALVFWLSSAGAIYMFWFAGTVFYEKHFKAAKEAVQDDRQAENITRMVSRQKKSVAAHSSTLGIGRYTFELRAPAGVSTGGFSNSAEVEIFIECDSKETCDKIESDPTALRDRVSTVLAGFDRDMLLGTEGKNRLKRAIQRQLSLPIRENAVKSVYFSEFILN